MRQGELVQDGRVDQDVDLFDSVVQLERYIFITYTDMDNRSIRIFDTDTGVYAPAVAPGIEAQALLDYSGRENDSFCANWPIYPQPIQFDFKAIKPDGSMIYREETASYATHLGRQLDRSRDLVVRNEMVVTIHWAY